MATFIKLDDPSLCDARTDELGWRAPLTANVREAHPSASLQEEEATKSRRAWSRGGNKGRGKGVRASDSRAGCCTLMLRVHPCVDEFGTRRCEIGPRAKLASRTISPPFSFFSFAPQTSRLLLPWVQNYFRVCLVHGISSEFLTWLLCLQNAAR